MGLILVASEDSGTKETIKAALSVQGWWVTAVGDRQTALQVAADQAPELVIVDSALPESLELVRAFGSRNGGPGALVCAPGGDPQESLGLHEAGADEVLTKPVGAAEVLQAVERSLATPRAQEPERPSAPAQLLTSEEIFGDVLRELEEGKEPAPSAAAEPEAAPSPEPIAPPLEPPASGPPELGLDAARESAPPPAEDAVGPAGASEEEDRLYLPPVSEEPEAPPLFAAEEAAEAPEASWLEGEETAGIDASLDGASFDEASLGAAAAAAPGSEPADVPVLAAADAAEPAGLAEPPTPGLDLGGEPEPAARSGGIVPPLAPPAEELAGIPPGVEEAEPPPPPPDRRRRLPIYLTAAAAALVATAGVVWQLRTGDAPSEPAVRPLPIRVTKAPAPGANGGPVSAARRSAAAEPPLVLEDDEPGAAAATEAAPELDVGAIVDEELRRREAALREVFLEEERRLLRELRTLEEPAEPAAEQGDAGAAAGG